MRTDHPSAPAPKADSSWRIGIVYSTFYKEEVDALIAGAKEALISAGLPADNITLHQVAGSFEIPLLGSVLAKEKKVDGLIGLGIIVEGETEHGKLVADAAAKGMMDVQVQYQVPFAFEILYVRALQQAKERASGEHNKGAEAARAVVHSLAQIQKLHS